MTALVCAASAGQAALSGSYTINAGLPASASNYVSFEAAVSDLVNGTRPDGGPVNGPGITATTIFDVANGTYTLAATLNIKSISGTSPSSRVIFRSAAGSAASVTVQYTSTSTAQDAVFRIKGADNLMFERMTILNNTASTGYGKGIYLDTSGTLSNTSDSIVIRGCIIRTRWGTGSTTAAVFSAVNNRNLRIIGNTIQNTFGIWFNGLTTAPYPAGLQIDSNTFNISGSDAFKPINVRYASGVKIRYNLITKNGCCADAHMEIGYINGASEISYNRINSSAGSNGILLDNINPNVGDVTKVRVFNNMLALPSSNIFGIKVVNSKYLDIYHNSVYLTNAANGSTARALELSNSNANATRVKIVNNIFFCNNSYAVHITGSTLARAQQMVDTLNYNLYFNGTSLPFAHLQGTDYRTITAFAGTVYATAGGNDASSLNRNPFFISTTDLHLNGNSCFIGLPWQATQDFDGESRSSKPMMGCDEPARVSNNIGTQMFLQPSSPFSAGSQNIKFVVMNYGSNTITSFNSGYNVNYGSLQTQTHTVTMGVCDSAHVLYSGAQQYNFGGGYELVRAFTSLPNGSADAAVVNDTSQLAVCVPLSGTYTINPAGSGSSNFKSFTEAARALNSCGVNAPVTFNVSSGTYNEQVAIDFINGASATNFVRFQSASGTASSVNLSFNSTVSTANYTLRLQTASYVKFNNITITALNTSNGIALSLINGCSYDTFTNVTFTGPTVTNNSTSSSLVSSASGINNFICLQNCTFNNGSMGVYISASGNLPSSENFTVKNCRFVNQYSFGTNINQVTGLRLINNTLTTNSAFATYQGLYSYWVMIPADANRPFITGNRISGGAGGNGIYNQYIGVNSTVTTARRALVANNFIQIGSGANATFGLRDDMGNGVDYIHNSVNVTTSQNTNTSAAGYFSATAYGSNTVLNNVFASETGAPAIRINNTSFYPTVNYNNLFTTGTNLAYLNTTAYTTLGTWQAASVRDANSINVNPFFTTASDLHSNQSSMNNAGTVSSLVTTDIDGQSRCPNGGCPGGTSFPDIGADEFIPVANDALVSAITAPTLICPGSGSNSVIVTIKNQGTSTLTSANIAWTVNGVLQTPYAWTGSLAQGSSATGITIGSFSFTVASNTIRAWTESPNSTTDGNPANDTSAASPQSTMNGTYTIGGSSPDFNTLTEAVSALNTRGVCGPVIFNIRQGTYNEKVQINAITGSSAANTIQFLPDPANTSAAIITASGNTSTTDNYTIYLNATKFITFRGLDIRNTSTGSWGSVIRLTGSQDSVSFIRNTITGVSVSSTSTNYALINSTGGNNASDLLHRFTLDSNTLVNGSYGVYQIGNSTAGNYESRCRIRNNTFSNQHYGAIYVQYLRNTTINGNVVNSNNLNSGGVAMSILNTDTFNIIGNNIMAFGQTGMNLNSANHQNGTGTYTSNIVNNFIGGTNASSSGYCIYLNQPCRYINFFHNSLSAVSSNGVFYFQQTSAGQFNNLDIRNNSIANFGSGVAAYFYNSPAITGLTINYNNYYTTGSTLFTLLTTSYSTGTGGSPTYNANSKSGNPGYINSLTNLHSITSQLADAGVNISSVTTDIDGDSRPMLPSSTVDIGADEFNVPAYNIGVSSVTAPACPVTAGLQNVSVNITNSGTATITSATVKYKVGRFGTVKSVSWTGSLTTGSTTGVTFSGTNQHNFTKTQIDSIIAWTEQPNGNTDQVPGNDTSLKMIYIPLSGVYTVGGSSPNFSNLTQVADALNCEGITGAVHFKIRNGTYSDAISLGVISGASATNTITFSSETGNAAATIWQPNNASITYTVRLQNTKHIAFRNLTVRNTNSSASSFQITSSGSDSCMNIIIQGCSMNNTWGGSSATSSINATGRVNGLKILRNTFTWSFGVTVIGNSSFSLYNRNLVMDSNNFVTTIGDVFTPFNIQYAVAPLIRYNSVLRAAGGGALTGDIRNISGPMVFAYNKVNAGGVYGMKFSSINVNGETTPALIHNNFITDNNNSSGSYALNIENSNYVHVYNNSLYQNATAATSIAMRTYATATFGNVRVVNNNMVANTASLPFSVNGNTLANARAMINQSNYNNLFVIGSTTSPLMNVFGTTYTTITGLQGAVYTAPSNNDLNSISVNPAYVSASANDLHVSSTSPVIGKGVVISSITKDIDMNPRYNPYDIGADQIGKMVRPVVGDFVGTCVNLSGSSWIDLTDSLGNIVFSINPNGNNLGTTCWGIRILNSPDGLTRTINMPQSTNGLGYWLDRNGYISPANQPGSPVSIRYYLLNTELADITKYASTGGVNLQTDSFLFLRDSMIITKFNGSSNNLIPDDNLSAANVTGVPFSSISSYQQNAVYVQFNVSSFSEFTPTFFPSSTLIPLPVEAVKLEVSRSGQDALLTWSANSVNEILYFDVERIWNNGSFRSIGRVQAQDINPMDGKFRFTDKGIGLNGNGTATYRVTAVLKGKSISSPLRTLYFGNAGNVSIGPNPFRQEITVDFPRFITPETPIEASLVDATGKTIRLTSYEISGQKVIVRFPAGLSSGMYVFRLNMPGYQTVEKMIRE